jgi:murein L,D-transpeptidase YcbB/YkuD
MNNLLTFNRIAALFLLLSLAACNQRKKESIRPVLRDSTITVTNSYSELFIDSLENMMQQEELADTLQQRIKNFYNARNYEFAWFTNDGLSLQAQGFWHMHETYFGKQADTGSAQKQLHIVMDTLLAGTLPDKLSRDTLEKTEYELTRHFFDFVKEAYGSKANPEDLQWHIPKRKLDPMALLDSFLVDKPGDWKPLNLQFHNLENAITKYREIANNGGWDSLRSSQPDSVKMEVRKRLQLLGVNTANDSLKGKDSLSVMIKMLQESYTLPATGTINAAFIKALNMPIEERIRQMLLNLERMKWLPPQPEHFILVNIPDYLFRVFDKGKVVLSMNVVVGKEANKTEIFSDQLKYIVFSPYWNVPTSIVRNEIAPAIRRNRSYLTRNNMEITGYSGGLPIVRQKPGKNNSLGQVKFLFPNSYNIYFHDTPSKSLFSRDKRAFSHGCIRLSDPAGLAKYLLAGDSTWTDDAIETAMNLGKEKWVTLPKPVPVFITYFTSWVSGNGLVKFREDIYGHDKALAEKLFTD